MWIVKVALSRPYTFIVLALLILIRQIEFRHPRAFWGVTLEALRRSPRVRSRP
jgi:type IV secretory pathway VirB3-like protein